MLTLKHLPVIMCLLFPVSLFSFASHTVYSVESMLRCFYCLWMDSNSNAPLLHLYINI